MYNLREEIAGLPPLPKTITSPQTLYHSTGLSINQMGLRNLALLREESDNHHFNTRPNLDSKILNSVPDTWLAEIIPTFP